MNILILGSGGREHALAWKISQSPLCEQLYIAPGNAGTASHGSNIALNILDFNAVGDFCMQQQVELLLVGPEDPLVKGIYDHFNAETSLQHIHVIGPSMEAAQLEGSKSFAKEFMHRHGIPTAGYREFHQNTFDEGITYIRQHSLPIVLKADGLAAGKGVVIAGSHDEAVQTFTQMLREHSFGEAGNKVVVEEFLDGIECSVFVLTDGIHYVMLPSAKDYKRVGLGDTGLNTGGMGAVSPVPFMDDAFYEKVIQRIVEPGIRGLQQEGLVYKGFLFIGLIKVGDEPLVIEYNCRMGDPETEVVMPRIENDLLPLLLSLREQTLHEHTCKHSGTHAATVMLVSGGYPGAYEKGKEISGLDSCDGSILFHAGTDSDGSIIRSNGGRVLAVTSVADSLNEALATSKRNAEKIQFESKYYRSDIGFEFI